MRGRVMLRLLAGREVILSGRFLRLRPDAMTPAEGGQSRVGQIQTLVGELLMDPDQIALAGSEQLQNPLPVKLRLLGTDQDRHFV